MTKRTAIRQGEDVAALMRDAVAAHQAGDIPRAESGYQRVLLRDPRHAEALYLSGAIAAQGGRVAEALDRLQKCVAIQPAHMRAVEALGITALNAEHFDLAARCYERLVKDKPGDPQRRHLLARAQAGGGDATSAAATWEACFARAPTFIEAPLALAWLAVEQERWADAERWSRAVLAHVLTHGDALYLLANALRSQGRMAEAADVYARVVTAQPRNAPAFDQYGGVLIALGRKAEARQMISRAIERDPNEPNPYTNLGRTYHANATDAAHALALHDQALALQPDFPAAINNRGTALYMLGRYEEAVACHRHAIALKPDVAEAHSNLGNDLQKLGDLDGALACYDRAIACQPTYAEAYWNAAQVHLLRGELAEAWPRFDWRWRCAEFPSPHRGFSQPEWNGERTLAEPLLVWGEQGVGDEVLYGSMVPDLARAGLDLIWEMDGRLVPLIARSYPGIRTVARQTPADPLTATAAAHIPTASLGRYLRNAQNDFPAAAGYLRADEDRAAAYRRRLCSQGERLVGLSWISKNEELGEHKTMPLTALAPVLATQGMRFVDLQYGDTAAERVGTTVQHLDDLDLFNDLDGLAALIRACDLVITVSNTTAHLAGALGVPVWVVVPKAGGKLWYWGEVGERTPWYPSARLFRQDAPGVWTPAVDRIAAALGALPQP